MAQNERLARGRQYKNKYGITIEQYEAMLMAQDFKCWICREPCSTGRRLSVDHDHRTKKVRGLLCTNCNQGLGKFKENPDLLSTASVYLELMS